MTTKFLTVPDISCEHCERAITNALRPIKGVESVAVDIPAKQVRVVYNETLVDVEHVKEVLREEDYPVAAVADSR